MKALRLYLIPLLFAAGLAGCQHGGTTNTAAQVNTTGHHIELGMQAWTLNRGTFAEAVEKTSKLGIRYIQAFPRQKIGGGIDGQMVPTMDAETRAKVLAMLASHNVKLTSFGVVRGETEEDWRQIFSFARDMGLHDIACEPSKAKWNEIFPMLDRLSREYGVAVSIHNHPNPSNPPSDPVAALAAYGSNMGLCGDTGHWSRSGFDPVDCLRAAEGRLISLHFKDLTEIARNAHDVPWGTGAGNAAGQIAELRRQGFQGIAYIEYEYRTPQLESEVARCVEYFRLAEKASDNDLLSGRVVPPGFSREVSHINRAGADKGAARWDSPAPLFRPDFSNASLKPGSWAWDNGVLVAKGGGDLWTKESYGDFALSAEFKCEAGSDSGVFIRAGDTANPADSSLEVQIREGTEANVRHLTGAILDCLAPAPDIEIKPGEWHTLTIIAQANRVRVILDQVAVVEMNLDQWKEPGKNPDGSANRFPQAVKALSRVGPIGLQDHGTPVAFRNVVIERL